MPLNEFGQEIPDDTPVVIHLPGGQQVNQFDDVKKFIDLYLSQRAAEEEFESMEEANDFDVEGDELPLSPHEYSEDTERADREVLASDPSRPDPTGQASEVPPVSPSPAPKPPTGNPVGGAPPAEGPTPPAAQ